MGSTEEPSLSIEELQGEWKASRGEAVVVHGTELSINGKPMPGGLKLSADGRRVVGFSIYKLQPEGTKDGQVFWQAGMQEIIWRHASKREVEGSIQRMTSAIEHQGEGRAAATLGHGASEHALVTRLNALLDQWREGDLVSVRSCDICPDWTNRAQTGLSVDHVHYIATMIATNGFKSRRRGFRTEDGAHDVPILVRESADSELGAGALQKWREHTGGDARFPPFLLEGRRTFFCSLGNGHFSQALNLFRTSSMGIWTGRKYDIGNDSALREAVEDGVDSVVLSRHTPLDVRKFISEMLNRSHGRQWSVGEDGEVHIEGDIPSMSSSQFVALSKVLDAEELSCLVRQKLNVDVDGTPMGLALKGVTTSSESQRSRL